MGFSVNLSVVRCLAVPDSKDEDFGKSAPFFYSTMKKLMLILCCLCCFNVANAEISWKLLDNGTLVISGTDMNIYGNYSPWYYLRDVVNNVEIENGVTNIGDRAFCDFPYLSSITIPSSVTSIGFDAFDRCPYLSTITIPNTITSIGLHAFDTNLSSIVVEEGNTIYDSRNNCNAIIETKSNTLIAGCLRTVIPNSVTSIGAYAFEGSSINSITIPNSVNSIGEYAFYMHSVAIILNQ